MDVLKPDAVYCLGDLVGYNVWPNEVINEIRRRGIPTIAGNYDRGIGLMSDECGCAYKTEGEKDMGKISIAFTNSLVKPQERAYLRTLPAQIRVEFGLNNDRLNLLLVHGSPRKINNIFLKKGMKRACLELWSRHTLILCASGIHTNLFTEYFRQSQQSRHATGMQSILVR
jgi:hypothetical protein